MLVIYIEYVVAVEIVFFFVPSIQNPVITDVSSNSMEYFTNANPLHISIMITKRAEKSPGCYETHNTRKVSRREEKREKRKKELKMVQAKKKNICNLNAEIFIATAKLTTIVYVVNSS